MKKFLLVNYTTPNTSSTEIPYLWLTLKSYFQRNSKNHSEWKWLDPLYSSYAESEQFLIDQIVEQQPDVLGVSCYMWNDKLTLHVAEQVKRKIPNIKIIAGGPALYYEHDSSWFDKNWFIDAVCEYSGYGEVFITDYLDWVNLKHIPFAVYPSMSRKFWSKSYASYDRRSFNYPLPYTDNINFLKKFSHKDVKVILDTTRGCPFSCSFCEWGGGTSTKVVFKPVEETISELEVIFDVLKPSYIDIIDANFGVVKQDITVTEKIIELHKKHKCLKAVNLYGPTKTKKENLKRIYDMLMEHGIGELKLSIQHTDKQILDNIKRVDMTFDSQLELFSDLGVKYDRGIRAEVLIGLPGETLDTYYNMLAEVSKSNLLEPMMHEWMMLPSAPAANPQYIEQMKIKTKKVRFNLDTYDRHTVPKNQYSLLIEQSGKRELLLDHKWLEPYEVVVSTYSYNVKQWVEMEMFKYYFTFLNKTRAITPIVKRLKQLDVDIKEFYRSLFNEFLLSDSLVRKSYDNFISSIMSDEPSDIFYTNLDDRLPYFSHYSTLKFIILKDPFGFYARLAKWLRSKYADDCLLEVCYTLADNVKSPIKTNPDAIRECISMCRYWGDELFLDDFVIKD